MTIPYHLCSQSITNCVANCGNGEATCSDLCFTGKKCGATSPTLRNETTTTSAPKPTKTSGDDDEEENDDDPFAEEDENFAVTMATSGTAIGLGLMAAVAGIGFLGVL